MKRCTLFLFSTLVPVALLAQAPPIPAPGTLPPPTNPVISDPSSLTNAYEALVPQWLNAVTPYAYDLFFALAGLEIAVFGWNLWRTYNGDLRSALLSTANKILIIGFFLSLLMNGSTWMADIINMFVSVGKRASGIPGLGPSMILAQGFSVFGTLLWQATKSGALADLPTAVALIFAAAVICCSFLVISFQFIVTKVQTFLALGMGFFFFGFGGSKWTTPYVERYFAYAVASGVKLMALYLLVGAGWTVTNSWVTAAQAAPLSRAGVEASWVIACGAVLFSGICWYGSSQVSQLLGGSPNLTHSDFVAFMGPMVSAGVTAAMVGAGVMTGGTATVAGGAAAGGAKALSATSGGTSPTGTSAPQPRAPSTGVSGSSSNGLAALGQLAQAGVSGMRGMPHGGSHTPPPHFTGFGH